MYRSEAVEYKYVILQDGSEELTWQPGENRALALNGAPVRVFGFGRQVALRTPVLCDSGLSVERCVEWRS